MRLNVKQSKLEKFACDLLVVNLFQGLKRTGTGTGAVNKALDGLIDKLIKEEGFEGKQGETMVISVLSGKIGAKRVLLLGMGPQKDFNLEIARRISAVAVKRARELKIKNVGTILHGAGVGGLDPQDAAQALTEGSLLAGYVYVKYKSGDEKNLARFPQTITISDHGEAQKIRAIAQGIKQGEICADAVIFARDLVNEPSSHMTPKALADIAVAIAKSAPPGMMEAKIFNRAQCEKMGMGAYLGVAKGSDHEPYFIHLTWRPPCHPERSEGSHTSIKAQEEISPLALRLGRNDRVPRIAIVGKGITFDSGGLSIKRADEMESMKGDMAGCAAMLGVFQALAKIKPNVEVHGISAVCENMPSGRALKPGDVLRAMNNKTIEVLNTDAEGRLTLIDALTYTIKNVKPDAIVDLATLTGSCIVALGEEMAGYMGNNTDLLAAIKQAADKTGEQIWELPLVKDYKEMLKSHVADYRNTTDREKGAGAIAAGLLLQEFVGNTPWAHLDIAGPAWAEKQVIPYAPKGGTGFGTRMILELIKGYESR